MKETGNQEPEVEAYFRPLGLMDEIPFKIIIAVIYLSLVAVCFAVLRQKDINNSLKAPETVQPMPPTPAEGTP